MYELFHRESLPKSPIPITTKIKDLMKFGITIYLIYGFLDTENEKKLVHT